MILLRSLPKETKEFCKIWKPGVFLHWISIIFWTVSELFHCQIVVFWLLSRHPVIIIAQSYLSSSQHHYVLWTQTSKVRCCDSKLHDSIIFHRQVMLCEYSLNINSLRVIIISDFLKQIWMFFFQVLVSKIFQWWCYM